MSRAAAIDPLTAIISLALDLRRVVRSSSIAPSRTVRSVVVIGTDEGPPRTNGSFRFAFCATFVFTDDLIEASTAMSCRSRDGEGFPRPGPELGEREPVLVHGAARSRPDVLWGQRPGMSGRGSGSPVTSPVLCVYPDFATGGSGGRRNGLARGPQSGRVWGHRFDSGVRSPNTNVRTRLDVLGASLLLRMQSDFRLLSKPECASLPRPPKQPCALAAAIRRALLPRRSSPRHRAEP